MAPLRSLRKTFSRAFTISGAATRAEFAWFLGFVVMILAALALAGDRLPNVPFLDLPAFDIIAAVLAVPHLSLMVRRLHDMGRSGLWLVLCVIPLASLLMTFVLLVAPPKRRRNERANRAVAPLASAVYAVSVSMVIFIGLRFEPYWIPAGSMKPTLLVGDYIFVDRWTRPASVERGGIFVFRHPISGKAYVKRLIGLPGDRVALRDGQVFLNGSAVARQDNGKFVEVMGFQGPQKTMPRCTNAPVAVRSACEKRQFVERLPGGPAYRVLDVSDGPADQMAEVAVPQGHLYFLGDNRDNSLDSRFALAAGGLGFVPMNNLVGRARLVLFSGAGSSLYQVWNWRKGRFLVPLD